MRKLRMLVVAAIFGGLGGLSLLSTGCLEVEGCGGYRDPASQFEPGVPSSPPGFDYCFVPLARPGNPSYTADFYYRVDLPNRMGFAQAADLAEKIAVERNPFHKVINRQGESTRCRRHGEPDPYAECPKDPVPTPKPPAPDQHLDDKSIPSEEPDAEASDPEKSFRFCSQIYDEKPNPFHLETPKRAW